ncbi:TlpA family protein disulfide reductase [Inmirania thermothiophila]|uniref:Thiol-disulfide isomerase/thioredoxin n=1 Tax=Inmirania thermothiophila TaxID=1750597 RepID=A0A3N1Y265_9GAMM|nr:TlpA disulfide reductase family protein [Inmirania thermothiophila]ROR32909.1 thiol-disulfide isomerase/thioredoxin [Inmirania thermothiophila]
MKVGRGRVPGLGRVLAVALAAFLAGCGGDPAAGRVLPEGRLWRLDGTAVEASAYRGRAVVLNFWATWCVPCREELPSLERLARSLDPARFAVVAVSVDDDVNLVREFLRETPLAFDLYLDRDRWWQGRLGVRAIPDTFLVAPDGRIVARETGPRQWDAPEMRRRVEAAYHGADAGG